MAHRDQKGIEVVCDTLIEAAEEIFLSKGFGNSTMREIAERAGITKSLIHYYFGSKKRLWREVKTKRFMDYFNQQQEAMMRPSKPNIEGLKDSIAQYFNILRRNTKIVQFFTWMFLEQDRDDCNEIDRMIVEQDLYKISAAQVIGQLRSDIDPRFIPLVFIGLCRYWLQYKAHFTACFDNGAESEDLDEIYISTVIKTLFEGILPERYPKNPQHKSVDT